MIEIKNVSKSFGKNKAVEDLTLHIKKGEFFGFLGPNGAGKTTTIKMMTGLLSPDHGLVEICGIDVVKNPEAAKRNIGFIPDTPYIYEKLSGREYIDFIAGLYNIPRAKAEKNTRRLFEIFGMDGWTNDRCEEYSHGMRQKILYCAAFMHEPEVLIIDEPMVGLDPQSTRLVKDLMKQYAELGNTVFVSTHTLSLAEELCDRIGIINQGKLVVAGSLEELRKFAASEGENLETLFLKITGSSRLSDLPFGFKDE